MLTKEQEAAVNSKVREIVVVAGPGSGKTKVLIERIHRITANECLPSGIVCITFTNAAAKEMLSRLKPEVAEGIGYCGTVHGYMLRLLRQHGAMIGFARADSLTVIDEAQRARMLQDVIDHLKFKVTLTAVKEQLAAGPWPFLDGNGQSLGAVELVAAEYYRRMIEANFLDYDSILFFGLRLVHRLDREHHNFGGAVHLLWDEFQDSANVEFDILRDLPIPNKFVVGDPDQSIYGFRGGSPRGMLRLLDHEDWQVLKLQKNFRSDVFVCEFANNLIGHNTARPDKTIIPNSDAKGDVQSFHGDDDAHEIELVARHIRNVSGGIYPDRTADPVANRPSIAVLLRFNALVEKFAAGLESFGIPVRRNVKEAKPGDWATCRSLINLFANPNNDQMAVWWVEQLKGKAAAKKMAMEAAASMLSINEVFLKLPKGMAPKDAPAALMKSGISRESVALVQKAIDEWPGQPPTLTELSFALGDDELHQKEEGEGVTVTTIHSAKGREWDVVYLPALEEGIVPSLSKKATIEEERRLLFVAVTRARHWLVGSYAKARRPMYGYDHRRRAEPTEPSRFIREMQP